jgi:hypothetical protein
MYILLNSTVDGDEQSHSRSTPSTHGERAPLPAVSGGQDSWLGPVTSPRQIRRRSREL